MPTIDDEARRLVSLLQEMGVRARRCRRFPAPELARSRRLVRRAGPRRVTWWSRSSTSTAARKSPSSSSRAARSRTSRRSHTATSTTAAIVETAAPASLRLHVVVGDAEAPPSSTGLDPHRLGSVRRAQAGDRISPRCSAEDVAVLAYTSGTTSDPKGVIHDHRTMLSELRHMKAWVTPGKPNLGGSPVTHATGMLGVLGPLATGESIHLIDRWDPAHALEVMLDGGHRRRHRRIGVPRQPARSSRLHPGPRRADGPGGPRRRARADRARRASGLARHRASSAPTGPPSTRRRRAARSKTPRIAVTGRTGGRSRASSCASSTRPAPTSPPVRPARSSRAVPICAWDTPTRRSPPRRSTPRGGTTPATSACSTSRAS